MKKGEIDIEIELDNLNPNDDFQPYDNFTDDVLRKMSGRRRLNAGMNIRIMLILLFLVLNSVSIYTMFSNQHKDTDSRERKLNLLVQMFSLN